MYRVIWKIVMMQQLEFSRAGGYYSLIRSTIEIVSLCMQCNLINKRHGIWMLQQTIWLWNRTSYWKYNFNEFVANILHDNMGMIIFDLWRCGGWWRPKTSYLSAHFGTLTFCSFHPSVPVLLTKDLPKNEISNAFQPQSASISRILEPSPQGLISSAI